MFHSLKGYLVKKGAVEQISRRRAESRKFFKSGVVDFPIDAGVPGKS